MFPLSINLDLKLIKYTIMKKTVKNVYYDMIMLNLPTNLKNMLSIYCFLIITPKLQILKQHATKLQI